MQSRPEGSRFGFDGTLVQLAEIASLTTAGCRLVPVEANLVDQIWQGRPDLRPVPIHNQEQYAGQPASAKLSQLREYCRAAQGRAYVAHDLAEIAWLLNLRGGDIPFSPVFQAYFICSEQSSVLFTDESKIDGGISAYLTDLKTEVKAYDAVWTALKAVEEGGAAQKVEAPILHYRSG